MNWDKRIGIALSIIAVVTLGGWSLWQSLFPSPLAQWIFYSESTPPLRGETYPPAKDSLTGKFEQTPALPEKNGALLTRWKGGKQCSLTVTAVRDNISIVRFQRGNPHSVQVHYVDQRGMPTELNVQLGSGVSLWRYADPTAPGDFIGWKFDNLAGKPLPFRYRGNTLLDGTHYKSQPNGDWRYEKYQNGQRIEVKTLTQLPAVDSKQHRQEELALIQRANQWLNERLQILSYQLSIPLPNDWLIAENDPCKAVNPNA